MKGSTAAGVTYIKSLFGGSPTLDVGTEYSCAVAGDTEYLLMQATDTSSLSVGTDSILYMEDSDSAYPTDWTTDVDSLTKLP